MPNFDSEGKTDSEYLLTLPINILKSALAYIFNLLSAIINESKCTPQRAEVLTA